MKTRNLTIIAILLFVTGSVFAQGNQGRKGNFDGQGRMNKADRFMNIPDLTDAQKTQLKDMRTANMKEMLPLRNEIQEKQAHLKTVSTGDNVNMNDVNKTLEELSAIKLVMAKKRAAHRHEIRKILTDDQRVFFDMHAGNKMKKGMKGKRGKMNRPCRNGKRMK